jgi:hypothetical protein
MDFWRKILLLAIIVLFTYILYRLLLKRSAILQKQRIEHFTPLMSGPSISSININSLTKSNGITDPSTAKQLKQFSIKASYHTAYNGTDLSSSMIKYALNRGYRWLDFCTSDGINVNYTTDDTFKEVQTTATSVAFPEIFTQIFTHGFISPDSPNPRDPIFVQIRPLFSSDKSNNAMIMTQIKGILDGLSSSYSTRVFSDRITKTTTIDQLLGKVVIVMDTNNNTANDSDNKESSINLNKLINISSNDNTFMTTIQQKQISDISASIPMILKDNFTTNPPVLIYQLLPTGSKSNSDVYSVIQKKGIQITPMAIWSNDSYLDNYEAIFNNANAAIVPLSSVLRYAKSNDPNLISSSYPGAFSGK